MYVWVFLYNTLVIEEFEPLDALVSFCNSDVCSIIRWVKRLEESGSYRVCHSGTPGVPGPHALILVELVSHKEKDSALLPHIHIVPGNTNQDVQQHNVFAVVL